MTMADCGIEKKIKKDMQKLPPDILPEGPQKKFI
jgi:hypothetical protein